MDGHDIGHILPESNPPALSLEPIDPRVPGVSGQQPDPVGSLIQVRHQNPTTIGPGWVIGWDARQWILQKAKKRGGEIEWRGVSYIASTKAILQRCAHENGATIDGDGLAFISSLPETFKEFIAGQTDA
jgi:hypothetical protein